MRRVVPLCALLAAVGAAVPSLASPPPRPGGGRVELTVVVAGLSNDEGVVRLAVCAPDTGFPRCHGRAAANAVVPAAAGAVTARIALPPGSYAISAFHDRNNNGRLDTAMGIPREGFGFSRNPPMRMRAATFEEARLDVDRPLRTTIRLRHIL